MKPYFFLLPTIAVFTFQGSLASPIGVNLDEAIQAINVRVAQIGLELSPLSKQCLSEWYLSKRDYSFQKQIRKIFDQAFAQNQLPAGADFDIVQYPGLAPRIDLVGIPGGTVVNGLQCQTWEVQFLPYLLATPPALDENEWNGVPFDETSDSPFPRSVPVKVEQVTLSIKRFGNEVRVPALNIQFQISETNIDDLAKYFSTGYSSQTLSAQLRKVLGREKNAWIPISQIFRGWPAKWVNRFPIEMKESTGHSANDVCFGVSRQFFRDELANGGLDRSTEATEYLLKRNYRLLSDSSEPTFGDYLYLPGQHAIRFIMKDPESGRWIGFTAWSDARTPYRLWWVDQDYKNPLSAFDIAPDPTFPRKMDLWRRLN